MTSGKTLLVTANCMIPAGGARGTRTHNPRIKSLEILIQIIWYTASREAQAGHEPACCGTDSAV